MNPAGGDRFEAARRAMPLPELWRRYGLKTKVKGERFETPFTPCCGEATRSDAGSLFIGNDDSWRWHCFRCSRGGSAIDFVAKMDGCTPKDAVTKLLNDGGGFQAIMGREPAVRRPRTSPVEKAKALHQVMTTLLANKALDPKVRDYLVNERKVPLWVVEEAVNRRILRTLPGHPDAADLWLRMNCGEETLLKSGLLNTGKRRCGAAYRPMVFLSAKVSAVEFSVASRIRKEGVPKALQYGEKTLPLVWMPRGEIKKIMVVEGGIDLLSCVSLGFDQETLLIGLLGASSWNVDWIKTLCEKFPRAAWQLGLDLDAAGENSHLQLIEVIEENGSKVSRLPPWGGGGDWNDTLIAAKAIGL